VAIQWPELQITPHKLATTFANESNPKLLMKQIIREVATGNFPTTEPYRKLLADMGRVSLWFYLRFICGSAGPYDKLNTDVHVDMCNYRQSMLRPGVKGAILVPRATYKSTIASHGANSWELIRNPDLTIGCTSQIYDRAQAFVEQTISNFTENDLHKWLYPEFKKVNRTGDELILENRTKRRVEPNLRPITAGGATAGIHVDLFNADDIVGEDMLNGDRSAGADMYKMTNWLHSNLRTLVVSWASSRVVVVGTRYSLDDPYERIMQHSVVQYGYWDEVDYAADEQGDWETYYRPAVQNDTSIFPEAYTVESLAVMAETDPWLKATQYDNNPLVAGISDFAEYKPGDCVLDYEPEQKDFRLTFDDGYSVLLAHCDLVGGGDPSGGGKARGPKSSKNAVCCVARTPNDRVAIIEAQSGYVEPTRFFDWLADYQRKYGPQLRATYVEAVAGFKAMVRLLQVEARKRNLHAPLPVQALGEKESTIRNIIQPYLSRKQLYIRKEIRGKVMEELRVFPSHKMDLLDAIKIAIFKTHKPQAQDESDEQDDDDDENKPSKGWLRAHQRNNREVSPVTGY
jgi:hypothetical protein